MSGHTPHRVGGLHSVKAALRHGPDHIIAVWYDARRHDRRLRQLLEVLAAQGVALHAVERAVLDRLTPDIRHQGIVADTLAPAAQNEADLDRSLAELDGSPLLLVLDGVQDPHNLGACLRSADAAGVNAVITPKDRSVGLTPVACKVASGAAETVPFVQVTNLARTLRHLRDVHRVWTVGMAAEAETDLYRLDLRGPLALVLGGEEKGLRRLTREQCDQLAHLPMAGSVASLNVSVAGGICLYEAVRQRGRTST